MISRVVQLGLLLLIMAVVPHVEASDIATATPTNVTVPAGHTLSFTMAATGVQVFACDARPGNPEAFEWAFKAPVADLWDNHGDLVGTHYAGPTWEANDGSTVTGAVVERADAASSRSIPWLLLKASPQNATGVFGAVTYIQRLDTVGGIAPTDGCDRSMAGTEQSVEYRATYAFFSAASASNVE